MSLLPDHPSSSDALKFRRYLDALERLLFVENVSTPLSIGVFGEWGTGKSTLLKHIKAKLDATTPVRFKAIEFTPWAYRHEPNLLVPLLLVLMKQTNARFYQQVKKIALVTAYHLVRKTVLPAIKVATGGLADAKEIKESGEAVEKDLEADEPKLKLSDRVKLREMVENLVKKVRGRLATEGNEPKLVFLIDDLDRCHPPDRIVEILEEIKVFLDLEGCIFVIACDRAVVTQAIDGKFPGQGNAYLEKFIQVPFMLPRSHPQLLSDMLGVIVDPGASDSAWLAYWTHLSSVLSANPRRLKRLFNEWRIGWEILCGQAKARNVDRFLLAKWLLLRSLSPLISERPELILKLEVVLTRGASFSAKGLLEDYGLPEAVMPFLNYDLERRFDSGEILSLYGRLTPEELVITRFEIELMVMRGEALPHVLDRADLSSAQLAGANFAGCSLCEINFRDSNLEGANFDEADLAQADFSDARFEKLSLKRLKNADKLVECPAAFKLTKMASQQMLEI